MPDEARTQADRAIVALLQAHLPATGSVLSYAPLPDEVDLSALNRELAAAGRLLLPRVSGREITLHGVHDLEADLARGSYGIAEPITQAVAGLTADSVILVPGRAFDRAGMRLGRGGGYYDRLLAAWPQALSIGIGYDVQVIDHVPAEPHDRPVGVLVSPRGWFHV